MMRLRTTLNSYMARQYALHITLFMFGILTVMALFDMLELMRRLTKTGAADFSLISFLAILKLPNNLMIIAPFAVLFAAIFTLSQLTRRQELVVMRTAGASLWQLLFPLFSVAFLYGVGLVTVINPLSAATEQRYQHYEEQYLRKEQHMISLLNQGLWLRQGTDDGYILMHARKVQLPQWSLDDVIVIFFGNDHAFRQRLDSGHGVLRNQKWEFGPGTLSTTQAVPQKVESFSIPTDLTQQDIEESFASPETVSFWQMPAFIQMLRSTGFPVTALQIHYGALWMTPFLCAALIMVAGAVTIRPPRQGGQAKMVVVGILLGFVVFFMTNFLQALGSSGQIPVILAACAPACLTIAGGVMAMFALEDQ